MHGRATPVVVHLDKTRPTYYFLPFLREARTCHPCLPSAGAHEQMRLIDRR